MKYSGETGEILTLDRNHNSFFQIQGQLYCANRKSCDLLVYTFKDIKIERINRDDQFIEQMISKLLDFYKNHFKDTIVETFCYNDYLFYNF